MLRKLGTSLAVVLLTGSFAFAAQGPSAANSQQTPTATSQPAEKGTEKPHKKKGKKHRKPHRKGAPKGTRRAS